MGSRDAAAAAALAAAEAVAAKAAEAGGGAFSEPALTNEATEEDAVATAGIEVEATELALDEASEVAADRGRDEVVLATTGGGGGGGGCCCCCGAGADLDLRPLPPNPPEVLDVPLVRPPLGPITFLVNGGGEFSLSVKEKRGSRTSETWYWVAI